VCWYFAFFVIYIKYAILLHSEIYLLLCTLFVGDVFLIADVFFVQVLKNHKSESLTSLLEELDECLASGTVIVIIVVHCVFFVFADDFDICLSTDFHNFWQMCTIGKLQKGYV